MLKFLKSPTRVLIAATLALPLALAPGAQAQPDINNAPKADNPQNRPPRPKRPPRQKMTPEERQEQQKKFMQTQLKRMGVTDEKEQSALTDYVQNELDARQKLMESGRALSQSLRADGVTDAQIAALLNSYNVALEDEKLRRTDAQKKLNESMDLTKIPRVEAYLTLMGLYGEGSGAGMGGGQWNRKNKPAK